MNQSSHREAADPVLGAQFWGTAAVVWTACVLGMAVSPLSRMEWVLESLSDKTLHGLAFAIGTIVWIRAVRMPRRKPHLSLIIGAAITMGVGLLIEFLQRFVPGRSPEFADLIANSVGILLGVLFALPGLRKQLSS